MNPSTIKTIYVRVKEFDVIIKITFLIITYFYNFIVINSCLYIIRVFHKFVYFLFWLDSVYYYTPKKAIFSIFLKTIRFINLFRIKLTVTYNNFYFYKIKIKKMKCYNKMISFYQTLWEIIKCSNSFTKNVHQSIMSSPVSID